MDGWRIGSSYPKNRNTPSATSEEVVGDGKEKPDLTREQAFLCNRAEHWFAMYVHVRVNLEADTLLRGWRLPLPRAPCAPVSL